MVATPGEAEVEAVMPAAVGLAMLDLPELALDHVLEELSLASMVCMCAALRDHRCSGDTLWERAGRHHAEGVGGGARRQGHPRVLAAAGTRTEAGWTRKGKKVSQKYNQR